MPIMSTQNVYCRACGEKFLTNFMNWGGEVCNEKCWLELQWRKALSTQGKSYSPRLIAQKKV